MTFMVIVILSIVVLSESPETMANSEEELNSLTCDLTLFSIPVTQRDRNGRKCWGVVNVWGCEGRCYSYSEPHWKFPYKISRHPSCIHDQRVSNWTNLSYCEPGAANGTERYEYTDARSCSCSRCESSTTSCESMHKRGKPSPPVVQDMTSVMDILLRSVEPRRRNWPESISQILQPPVYP